MDGMMSSATFVDTPRAHKKGAIAALHVYMAMACSFSNDAGTLVLSETAGSFPWTVGPLLPQQLAIGAKVPAYPMIKYVHLHAYQIWLACADSDDPFLHPLRRSLPPADD